MTSKVPDRAGAAVSSTVAYPESSPSSQGIVAIDVHGHYGLATRSEIAEPMREWLVASAETVARRARASGIEATFVSPLAGLFPRGAGDAAKANEIAHREVAATAGLYQYVIVNPLQPETYAQARRMLRTRWCVGIKIHPEEHCYHIRDHGQALFRFFAETGARVLTHSGCPNSLPDDFVPYANEFPEVRLLIAHLGNGAGAKGRVDLQVRAVQAARHGNVWIDTSSSMNIVPGLLEWAVKEVSAERLLFGTDTPLYHVPMQRARVDGAEISEQAKRAILRENALRLFAFKPDPAPTRAAQPSAV
jgi:uncharacterized protein